MIGASAPVRFGRFPGMDLQRLDAFGGKLIARFWGTLLLLAIVLVAGGAMVYAVATGQALVALLAALLALPGLLFVRFLFSSKRKLSDFD